MVAVGMGRTYLHSLQRYDPYVTESGALCGNDISKLYPMYCFLCIKVPRLVCRCIYENMTMHACFVVPRDVLMVNKFYSKVQNLCK